MIQKHQSISKNNFIFSIYLFCILFWIGTHHHKFLHILFDLIIFFKNKFYFREQYISSRTFTRSLTQVKLIDIRAHAIDSRTVNEDDKVYRSMFFVHFDCAICGTCYLPIAIHLILFCVCVCIQHMSMNVGSTTYKSLYCAEWFE